MSGDPLHIRYDGEKYYCEEDEDICALTLWLGGWTDEGGHGRHEDLLYVLDIATDESDLKVVTA